MDLHKLTLYISKLIIQSNTGSCCVRITGDVDIYLYVCVGLLVPVCLVCMFVYVSGIKSEY